jgi:thiamine-monophosphate kinase
MTVPEKALISQIRRWTPRTTNSEVRTGIGDDCAVLRLCRQKNERGKGNDTLVTTDFCLEGVHFRRDWHPPDAIAYRCLARGLSDIAAMGGRPVAAFLSMALPGNLPRNWAGRFVQSLIKTGESHKVTLAGGDTAESPHGILLDIIILGAVPRGGAILRSGARPGDGIYVTGELGGSAAAIRQLDKNPASKIDPSDYPRHFSPVPRIAVGRAIRERGLASAMIDTSDGLSTDLAHICEESGVGAELQQDAIPRAIVGKHSGQVDLELALHGGEDYELLFTAPPHKRIPRRIAGVPVTRIGQITGGRKVLLVDAVGIAHKLEARGWEHFRK